MLQGVLIELLLITEKNKTKFVSYMCPTRTKSYKFDPLLA